MGSGGSVDQGGSDAQDFRLEEQKRMQGVGVSPVQRAFARNITAAQQLRLVRRLPHFRHLPLVYWLVLVQ